MTSAARSCRSVADFRVFHENHPAFSSRALQPHDIFNAPVGRLTVDLGQGAQPQPCLPEQGRHLLPAEAAVEKQVGQPWRMPNRHGSGSDACGDPDRVLEFLARDTEFVCDDIERLSRPKHCQCILDARTTAGKNGLAESPGRID